jgi:hypothetical protein
MSRKVTYLKYYNNQAGRGIPVFIGARRQRGHGLGSMIVSWFKNLLPVLQPAYQSLKDEAINTGINVLKDVAEDMPLKQSLQNRAKIAKNNLIRKATSRLAGEGINARKPKRLKQSPRSCRRDIFS